MLVIYKHMYTSLGNIFGLMLNFCLLFHLWQGKLNNNSCVMTYVHIMTNFHDIASYDIRNFYIMAALDCTMY